MNEHGRASSSSVWINGDLVASTDATISVFDHGLTVGDGVFETLRTVRREPFAVTRHLRRLRRSAAGIGLEIPLDDDALREALSEIIDAHEGDELRVRLTVTGGPGPAGSDRGDADPTVLVVAGPLATPPESTDVITVEWTRNEQAVLVGLKTTSYAENVVALARAFEAGATEALFPNTRGQLCEGTGTNVFVVVGGDLLTPPLSSGCLGGITRELVMEVTDVREADLGMEVLGEADELFISSSTRDVQAVAHVNGDKVGAGTPPGPVTARAAEAFAELLARTSDP